MSIKGLTYGLILLTSWLPLSAPQPTEKDLAAPQKEVTGLVYHRFGDDRYPSTNISLSNFEAHLSFLQEKGYQSVTFTEALEYLNSRKKQKPTICITIDDGFRSFFENGIPLLEQYGMKATVFINTSSVGQPDYMDWDEIKAMIEYGIEIGNHSHEHQYFLNLPEAERAQRFEEDLKQSQAIFQEHLGMSPTIFAYPYGEFDTSLQEVLKKYGFTGAAAQNSGVMSPSMDFFAAPRFAMSNSFGRPQAFMNKASMKSLDAKVVKVHSTGYMGSPEHPRLEINFKEKDYQLRQLQCFVQGVRATKSMRVIKDKVVKLSVKSVDELTDRRTVFTVTVPDANRQWHWFSYVYVRPEIEAP